LLQEEEAPRDREINSSEGNSSRRLIAEIFHTRKITSLKTKYNGVTVTASYLTREFFSSCPKVLF
jgi:hypothetical protein